MTTQEEVLARIDKIRGRKPQVTDETVTLAHGAGGKASAAIIADVFVGAFGQPNPSELADAALLDIPSGGRVAFSTDSYVVSPIRFPGASIAEIAVNGTVNDLAVSGAQPKWLSAAFIIEEGFPIADLRELAADARAAADKAGVTIVTGDTKVVPRGAADKVFITTSGIGVVPEGRDTGADRIKDGDRILISGPIASHGMAVMVARGNLAVTAPIESDSAPVNLLIEAMYDVVPSQSVRWMRDATRGGVATVLNELAKDSGLGVLLDDETIPIDPTVRGVCDMLGIDPLYVANEGCFIAVVADEDADTALAALRNAGATKAALVGEIAADLGAAVGIQNSYGGTRLVDMLVGDPLPRIC